ncbi:hypothetical protein LOC68_04755 [Blastopirellula sp. JC732]|uniref:Neutral/alkaline non-lysosomal ceramidase N-terminal domain-containing protein n=1 Tax=Blastopirellula sediminis TaxID=2894196 RepID=A0A9X1MLG8_9BACT|nr:hypothetical protein [Blastopirellula sediminis]MCC9609530.1 hypothetical protein [Blastopirellula sediminis]MCC9627694.1 hypothetical protein [Blastopirellula sediminis]
MSKLTGWLLLTLAVILPQASQAAPLSVAFGEVDITPEVKAGKPVFLAGYGYNRRATGVHDPIMARAVLLDDGQQRIAIVGVDLIGLAFPDVERIREKLPNVDYTLVASSHSHEGPDVIGIWGPNPFTRGVNDDYVTMVVDKVSEMVASLEKELKPATIKFGTAEDAKLLRDSRLPVVYDPTLRALRFQSPDSGVDLGMLVQWNCHPEAMGPKNTLLTGDFPATTVAELQKKYHCPIVYISGAVGGLLAPPRGLFHDAQGNELKEGDFAYCEAYGRAVAQLAESAIDAATPLTATPFRVVAKPVLIPVENPLYRLARKVGIVKRPVFQLTDDFETFGRQATEEFRPEDAGVKSEVAVVALGELRIACIPGEIYPELVYGDFQIPADPNADFSESPREPSAAALLADKKWMLFGLANDEVGYIIPKSQWDSKAPYAYDREDRQYGEINSCGPEVAPIVMEALRRRVVEMDGAGKE